MGRSATPRPPSTALTAALLGLTTAAAGAAVALGLLAAGGHRSSSPTVPLAATTSLSPREHFFGDRVDAVVDVRVQPDLVDPRTVSIDPSFEPYSTLGRPTVRRSRGSVVLHAQIACLSAACAPRAPQRVRTLAPVLIRFREGRSLQTIAEPWPPLLVASRLTRDDLKHPLLRARLQPLPTPTGRPLFGWALTSVAAFLFLLAGLPAALSLLGLRPRQRDGQSRPDELARALGHVERLAVDADEQRMAIDRLAGALARAGLHEITPRARALAWSRPLPTAGSIRRLLDSIERLTRRPA